MNNLFQVLETKNIALPADAVEILTGCRSFQVFNNTTELATAAVGGSDSQSFEVSYSLPDRGSVTEAVVHRVSNGVSANYTEAYMRRRDPDTMLIGDQYQAARCPLLGFELNYLTIEGAKIPSRFLQVHKQTEVENAGYDAGAEILYDFFRTELQKYLVPGLHPTGRRIIETCLRGGSVEEYLEIIPMDYQYTYVNGDDEE